MLLPVMNDEGDQRWTVGNPKMSVVRLGGARGESG